MAIDSHQITTASDSSPNALTSTSTESIPAHLLMTRREVAQTLRISIHCLSSNIVRYRRSDVLRLIEEGYKPFSSEETKEPAHDRV